MKRSKPATPLPWENPECPKGADPCAPNGDGGCVACDRVLTKRSPPLALDSGAYSVKTGVAKASKVNRETYAEVVKKIGDRFTIRFNFDVIGDGPGSYRNWIWFREQGLDVIPVYHLGSDEKYLRKYIRQADYIAIGAGKMRSKTLLKALEWLWTKSALAGAKVKVHGLAMTSFDSIARFPWTSIDSTSAIMQGAHGAIYVPYLEDIGKLQRPLIQTFLSYQVGAKTLLGRAGSNRRLFLLWPDELRRPYEEWIESRGFTIGLTLTDVARGVKPERKTLGGDWLTRSRWNALLFNEWLVLRNPTATWYHVVASRESCETMDGLAKLASFVKGETGLRETLEINNGQRYHKAT